MDFFFLARDTGLNVLQRNLFTTDGFQCRMWVERLVTNLSLTILKRENFSNLFDFNNYHSQVSKANLRRGLNKRANAPKRHVTLPGLPTTFFYFGHSNFYV